MTYLYHSFMESNAHELESVGHRFSPRRIFANLQRGIMMRRSKILFVVDQKETQDGPLTFPEKFAQTTARVYEALDDTSED